ncbi:LytR/AlgR family response regulator transcription factor [Undibacterium fentianense]|uniref:Response regulator transcription factor n=1 Tax=Undibacterium fentianense TaxID=2828728 RepID=A0A941DX83_9BURK|nr:LytTR family DNA-binding domain-containing protein [Undibacterium fentianense]MBR7799074.1 response regulator transcription factor [Undibacterium fentianense]
MTGSRILIVDDEAPARERLKTLLADIQDACPFSLIAEASDGQAALDVLIAEQADILLLDVQMPGMTGIELAQHIASLEMDVRPSIVFVTAYDEYAVQAFEVHAMDYLLKPVRAARLQEAITRIQLFRQQATFDQQQEQLQSALRGLPKQRQNFSVLEKNRVLLIPVRDVLFLKAEQKYVTIQTRDRAYLTEESLVSIESELGEIFVRVHRNALVARELIIGVERATLISDVATADKTENERGAESWQVILRGTSERLPISRRQWPTIKNLVR